MAPLEEVEPLKTKSRAARKASTPAPASASKPATAEVTRPRSSLIGLSKKPGLRTPDNQPITHTSVVEKPPTSKSESSCNCTHRSPTIKIIIDCSDADVVIEKKD